MKVLLTTVAVLISAALFAASSQRTARPNIILVTIDTVRADHVGCYGAKGVSTPTLDSLAHDGMVFERAIAQVPLTYPSHAAIMTGLYPFQNGAQDFTSRALDARFTTIAEVLRKGGYSTGAVVSSFALDHSWGLSRGFDSYDDEFSSESYKNRELGLVERKAEESVTHALAWLKRTPKRPFFLWLHLYDPHSPYSPPQPFRREYADHPYDGEIAYADQELGRVMDWMKQSRLYDSSLIIVASDHGEALGEHGEKEHGFFVYSETIRVPLIVKLPKRNSYKAMRINTLVETTQIAATIQQFAGFKSRSEPLPINNADDNQTMAYSETFYPFSSFGWSPLHSIQAGRFQYIDAPSPELYDVTSDPQEKNNLAASQTATVAVLKRKLDDLVAKHPYEAGGAVHSELSSEAQEKLRALGYVAYRSPVPQEALLAGLPDPKTKIDEFNSLMEAEKAAHEGEFGRARILLARIRENEPRLYIVPFQLGEIAIAEKDWAEAATRFRECLQLSPELRPAMTGLARSLMFQGKLGEAEEWARKILVADPQSYQAWYVLGFIESGRDRKAAIGDYEQAIAIQPNFAPLHRDLGNLELQERNFGKAAEHLEKAVSLGTDDPATWNSLGIAYSRTKRLNQALDAYKRALAGNPNVAEIHANLAAAYERLQHAKEAQAEYASACRLDARYCR